MEAIRSILSFKLTNGNFYGDVGGFGTNNSGTIYVMTPEGSLTTLVTFGPYRSSTSGLLQYTSGEFYALAGSAYDGEVLRMFVGLGPFVTSQPASGAAGTKIIIRGNYLTDATSVTFNGAAAAFKVAGACEITATVSAGATTGTIQVVTPERTLNSNAAFRVTE